MRIKKIIDAAFMFVFVVFILLAIVLVRIFTQRGEVFKSYYLLSLFLVLGLLAYVYYLLSFKTGKTTFLEYNEQSTILKDCGIALTTGGFIVVATSNGIDVNFLTGSGIVIGGLISMILAGKLKSKAEIAERDHQKLLHKAHE